MSGPGPDELVEPNSAVANAGLESKGGDRLVDLFYFTCLHGENKPCHLFPCHFFSLPPFPTAWQAVWHSWHPDILTAEAGKSKMHDNIAVIRYPVYNSAYQHTSLARYSSDT